jgi:ribosomal protein L20A (L18A)
MRKYLEVILFFAVLACLISFASKEESLEQLIARADAARADQQPDLYMQVADRLLKSASVAYKASQWEKFRAALEDIVKYSDNAHSAAMHSNKRVKRTEIRIRQISTRLRDIKLNVGAEDQERVQSAIDRLEGFRTELLHSMFGSKSND